MVHVNTEEDGHDEHGGDSSFGGRDCADSRIGEIPEGDTSVE